MIRRARAPQRLLRLDQALSVKPLAVEPQPVEPQPMALEQVKPRLQAWCQNKPMFRPRYSQSEDQTLGSGRSMVTVVPLATWLVSVISPPINSTKRLVMASPSPVPPCARVSLVSAWLNG